MTPGNVIFDLKDSNGNTYSAMIHIPTGISSGSSIPAVFIEDGRDYTNNQPLWQTIDSLSWCEAIEPVVIACLNGKENSTDRTEFFVDTFIPYVQKKWNVGLSIDNRVCSGISASADRCLILSMQNDTLFNEYWCFSPSKADISEFGLLSSPTKYRIFYSAAEEIEHFNYYPSLANAIRKRGGRVDQQAFDNSIATKQIWWPYLFTEELKRRFPGQDSSLK